MLNCLYRHYVKDDPDNCVTFYLHSLIEHKGTACLEEVSKQERLSLGLSHRTLRALYFDEDLSESLESRLPLQELQEQAGGVGKSLGHLNRLVKEKS